MLPAKAAGSIRDSQIVSGLPGLSGGFSTTAASYVEIELHTPPGHASLGRGGREGLGTTSLFGDEVPPVITM